MSVEEFINFIKSIGFEYDLCYYVYKGYHGVDHLDFQMYTIDLYRNSYGFHNGYEWINYKYNDLTPFKVFKKELRSIKLKELLR